MIESSSPRAAEAPRAGRGLRFAVLTTLYVSQAIPLGFFIVALPAILRDRGVALERIGLVSALAAPFLLKFLWAPLVDRWRGGRLGHFRSWIVPLQVGTVLVTAAIAMVDISDLDRSFGALVALGALFMLLAATQDVATDGPCGAPPRYRRTRSRQRRPGRRLLPRPGPRRRCAAGRLRALGLDADAACDRRGAGAAAATDPALAEPSRLAGAGEVSGRGRRGGLFAPLAAFVRRPGARAWIAVVLVYRAGETMAVAMLNPLLVDRGLSLATIGVLLGVASSLGSFGGALAGGFLVGPLGRRRALVLFAAIQAVAICGYMVPALGVGVDTVLVAVVLAGALSGGAATAALYTTMMDACAPESAASDFTLQQALAAVGPLVGASLSGLLAARLGYAGHFALCAGLAVVAAALAAASLRRPPRRAAV